jgi:hypothetical protein
MYLPRTIRPGQIQVTCSDGTSFMTWISIVAVPIGTVMHQAIVRVGRMCSWPRRHAPDTVSGVHIAVVRAGSDLTAGHVSHTISVPVLVPDQACARAPAARQPAGSGNVRVRWSSAPNRRRVRWLSARHNQYFRACVTTRTPVVPRRCRRLVNDHVSIRFGSTRLRQRVPRLSARTRSGSRTSFARNQ